MNAELLLVIESCFYRKLHKLDERIMGNGVRPHVSSSTLPLNLLHTQKLCIVTALNGSYQKIKLGKLKVTY
jgi:hypothetical protein